MFKKLFEIGTSKYDRDSDVFCLITFTQNALWTCPFPVVWVVWWYFHFIQILGKHLISKEQRP